ncbi:MAG: MFS transporter [Clostridia bacterium]
MDTSGKVRTGIKENGVQFLLLVVITLFVGSMVGLERTILPMIGESEFGIASTSAALSFIISFGLSKAVVNLFAGHIADHLGRKRVLLLGWMIGFFVPLLVIVAHDWWVIVLANLFLGINQGLTWSMTVNMKIDIAKPEQRGLAIGLNEFAGYLGVAAMALLTAFVASTYGLRPEPFYVGIAVVIIGLLLSLTIKNTDVHLQHQLKNQSKSTKPVDTSKIFQLTTWKDRNLSTVSFAGLSTNLKDGMAWGLLPLFLATHPLSVGQIGTIVAIYPASWGLFQLLTGALSDRIGRKWLIASGLWVQAASLWIMLLADQFFGWMLAAVLLGIGTAMVYPTLAAVISDVAEPSWRATSLGIFRFWRDSGYAAGAFLAGIVADLLNVEWAIGLVALIPFAAGWLSAIRLKETRMAAS